MRFSCMKIIKNMTQTGNASIISFAAKKAEMKNKRAMMTLYYSPEYL